METVSGQSSGRKTPTGHGEDTRTHCSLKECSEILKEYRMAPPRFSFCVPLKEDGEYLCNPELPFAGARWIRIWMHTPTAQVSEAFLRVEPEFFLPDGIQDCTGGEPYTSSITQSEDGHEVACRRKKTLPEERELAGKNSRPDGDWQKPSSCRRER
ncbi:MAG: hypothetical protein ABIF88_01975 [archaeon]